MLGAVWSTLLQGGLVNPAFSLPNCEQTGRVALPYMIVARQAAGSNRSELKRSAVAGHRCISTTLPVLGCRCTIAGGTEPVTKAQYM